MNIVVVVDRVPLCNAIFVSALGSPEMGRAKFPLLLLLLSEWEVSMKQDNFFMEVLFGSPGL